MDKNKKTLHTLNKQIRRMRLHDNLMGAGFFLKIRRLLLLRGKYIKYVLHKLSLVSPEVKAKIFFGSKMKLPISDLSAQRLYYFGILGRGEENLTKFITRYVRDDDVFYDIGANYGFYSKLAAYLISEEGGEVHLFEPVPSVFRYIKNNFSENNVFKNNIAVSNKNGSVKLFEFNTSGRSTTIAEVAQLKTTEYKEVFVDTISLDEYIKTYRKPTFIKIDVEGGEREVLKGATKLLNDDAPIVIVEVWPGEKWERFSKYAVDFLCNINYQPHRINTDGDIEPIESFSFFNEEGGYENIVFIKKGHEHEL